MMHFSASHSVHVWSVDLVISEEKVECLKIFLNPKEKIRSEKFHFKKDQKKFIVAHAALQSLLKLYLPSSSTYPFEFVMNEYGKPFLINTPLQFSLSHSDELALIAISKDRILGVDVEKIKSSPDIEGISKRFFTAKESDTILSLDESEQQAAFYNCWTRKEALIKAVGKGLSVGLDSFEVSLEKNEILCFGSSEYFIQNLSVPSDYKAALAIQGKECGVEEKVFLV